MYPRTQQVILGEVKVCIQAYRPIQPVFVPVFIAWSDYEYYYSLLDGMPFHRKVTLPFQHFIRLPWQFTSTYSYSLLERGTAREKFFFVVVDPQASNPHLSSQSSGRTNHLAKCLPQTRKRKVKQHRLKQNYHKWSWFWFVWGTTASECRWESKVTL